jgi:hypothetical protein
MLPPAGFREPWVSLAFEKDNEDNMKIRENHTEIPEAIIEISQSADSIVFRESIVSVKISESLRHAPTGTGYDLALPPAGTKFKKPVTRVFRQLPRQDEIQIPAASGYFADSALWQRRISNHTLHPTALRAGCCKSAVIVPPAQSRMLLPQPPRLRLAPFCCHPPLPESRG